jgi:hypothetical protein
MGYICPSWIKNRTVYYHIFCCREDNAHQNSIFNSSCKLLLGIMNGGTNAQFHYIFVFIEVTINVYREQVKFVRELQNLVYFTNWPTEGSGLTEPLLL